MRRPGGGAWVSPKPKGSMPICFTMDSDPLALVRHVLEGVMARGWWHGNQRAGVGRDCCGDCQAKGNGKRFVSSLGR